MKTTIIMLLLCVLMLGCKKQNEWLDVKSTKSDVVPTTIKDFQALLNNDGVMNANYPSLGIIGADNFYVTNSNYASVTTAQERNAYIWAKDIYQGEAGPDWRYAYQTIAYANIALEGLEKIKPAQAQLVEWNTAKGAALFFRAYAWYNLAQLFAAPYASSTAAQLGIPLRMSSDINERSVRASLADTYDRIITDCKEAVTLLPATTGVKTQPSKTAANALLARIYLAIDDYGKAASYAETALAQYNVLIDYNTLSATATNPFPTLQNNNKEVIFYSTAISFSIINNSRLLVDTFLFRSYAANDLRRTLFYKDNGTAGIAFKGNYTGNLTPYFAGIAVNELFFIRAEANARLGKIPDALADLNALLQKRFKTGQYTFYNTSNADSALVRIITERRKELPFTGNLRWEDLRRLNKDSRFAKTLTRVGNNTSYSLPPNDKRYVYPIPEAEIQINGMEQNQR